MDSAIANVFDQAKADTMVLFQDGMRAVTSEKEVALDSVRLLEEEKLEIETRLLAMENELHDSKMKLDALNHVNAGLQQRVRAVERVNCLLTNSINAACLHPHQHEPQPVQPTPSYHEANLLSANRSYKEEITQLRQHNTLLAGQVRALQDHLNGHCARPTFMTVAQTQNPPTNLSPSQNRQLENFRRAKHAKEA